MEYYSDQHACISLKDHKENFRSADADLINPSASRVGRLSKNFLNDILQMYLAKLKLINFPTQQQ